MTMHKSLENTRAIVSKFFMHVAYDHGWAVFLYRSPAVIHFLCFIIVCLFIYVILSVFMITDLTGTRHRHLQSHPSGQTLVKMFHDHT